MKRLEAIQQIVRLLDRQPVIANLGMNAFDLFAAGDRAENFYMLGAMGTASSVGLGLAMARPDLSVIVLEGDGSLLMSLGSLTTIGALAPSNLVIVVLDNQAYETTGGQATHTAHTANLAAIAKGAGLPKVVTAATLEEVGVIAGRSLREPGPWLIVVAVETGASTARMPLRPVYHKDRFADAMGPVPG